jgi:hypothetical protein
MTATRRDLLEVQQELIERLDYLDVKMLLNLTLQLTSSTIKLLDCRLKLVEVLKPKDQDDPKVYLFVLGTSKAPPMGTFTHTLAEVFDILKTLSENLMLADRNQQLAKRGISKL